ncbi:MAG: hypothetical protein EA412_00910 [Chitinophagaceae bacterium]|nr:MAG: hypothetical protein EA412_00910 [Chitinophagaceae bacterium]
MKVLKTNRIAVIIFLLFVLSSTSCLKDNLDFDKMTTTEWTPEFAVPLVFASLSVYDIITEDTSELFVIDQNTGQVALAYSGSLISFDIRDIIQLPDLNFEYLFNLSSQEISDFVNNGAITKSESYTYDISAQTDLKIETLVIEEGILELEITSDIQHSGELIVSIPGMERNNVPFEVTIPLDYNGSQISVTESVDLSNYTIEMNSGTQGNNEIGIQYVFSAEYEGQPITVADLIRIDHTFEKLEFLKIFGDIGEHTLLEQEDTINIDFFDNNQAGFFDLVSPYVQLSIANSFGLPIDIEIQTFQTRNFYTGEETDVFFTNFSNPFGLNAPAFNEVGETAFTNLNIDDQNSNLGSLLHSAPQQLIYRLFAVSNPGSATSPVDLPNFITNESQFRVDTEIILPLEGLAYGFVLRDTLDFSFGEQIDEVDSMALRIVIDNGFPFNANMQVYFADENFVVMDSVFSSSGEIILSGETDSDGIVIAPKRKITDIEFSRQRIDNMTNASHVIIESGMKTTNALDGETVKILDEYTINVNLGLFLAGKVNL